ncbi:MAG: alpha/beta hydrolase [Proteobacteria bacterium]|nr:alpha/beta hydrolase [Pseudomonadota bacterium]
MDYSTITVGPSKFPVHFYRAGEGEPLLYLHHLLGLAGFESVLSRLAESFDVIAPFTPGWGPAKDDLAAFDPGPLDLTLHHCDVLDALGVESAHIFGVGIGAWMGAELAAIAPQRVRKLVLVNPLGLWLDDVGGKDPFAQHPGSPSSILFSDPTMRERFFFQGQGKITHSVIRTSLSITN